MTDERALACLAMLLSVIAYVWYAQSGLTLGYGDALSRMVIARRVVAGPATGLGQLGTTWLPLHTMLMLPFIWNDTLFHSGLAGSIPSMVAYVLAAIYLYRTVHLLFGSRATAWVAGLIFMLNPSVLYMQSTAMSEVPLLAAASAATYYLTRWAKFYQAKDLVLTATAVAVSAGIRYDGWALAAVFAVIVVYLGWRRHGYAGAESSLILFAILAFSSCVAWVIYNAVIFHDPLLFLFFGNKNHTVDRLPSYHHLWLSAQMFGIAAGATAGWVMTALAALGLIVFVARFRSRATALPALALLTPIAYHWVIFYGGIDSIYLPELGFGGYWNERFGLMLLPAIIVFVAYLAHQNRYLRVGILGVALIFCALNATIETPMALREPLSPVSAARVLDQKGAAQWLIAHYHGGNVLLSYLPDAPMAYFLMRDISDQSLVADTPEATFQATMAHPEAVVNWIVLDTIANNGPVYLALHDRHDWLRYFTLREVIGTVQIYERISGPPAVGATPKASGAQPSASLHPVAVRAFDCWRRARSAAVAARMTPSGGGG